MIASLNWVDYAILGIIVLSALIAIVRGFIREALSLIVWTVAFWVALNFSTALATHFENSIKAPPMRLAVSCIVLFVGSVLIGSVITYVITQLVKRSGLTGTDRFIGVFFGIARGILLVALLVLVGELSDLPQKNGWMNSQLIPQFESVVQWLYQGKFPHYVAEHFVVTPPSKKDAGMSGDSLDTGN